MEREENDKAWRAIGTIGKRKQEKEENDKVRENTRKQERWKGKNKKI